MHPLVKDYAQMVTLYRNWRLAVAAAMLLLLVVVSCAPAADAPAEGVQGIDVGNTSPPFAMTLEDGSEVSLKDIVDDDQPAHIFWFATW